MTCDACRNRILAAEHPATPPAEIAAHLAGCAACRSVQRQAKQLDALVATLPVPEAAEAKARFLAKLERLPVVERRSIPSPRRFAWPVAVAAALLLAVGGVWMFTKPKPGPEIAQKPRHELLTKEVAYVTRLANADSAPGRLQVWTEWSKDLRGETCDVIRVAPAEDLSALAGQYERAVRDGVVAQAKRLPDRMDNAQRNRLLKDARAALEAAEADAKRLRGEAPPHAQKALAAIEKSAAAGIAELDKLPGGAS